MNLPASAYYWNLPPGVSPRDCDGPRITEETNYCRICDKRIEVGERLCESCWEQEEREKEIDAAELRMALTNPKFDR